MDVEMGRNMVVVCYKRTRASCFVLCAFSSSAAPFLNASSSGFSGFTTAVFDFDSVAGVVVAVSAISLYGCGMLDDLRVSDGTKD